MTPLEDLVDRLETETSLQAKEDLVDAYWDMRGSRRTHQEPQSIVDLDNRVRVCLIKMNPPSAKMKWLFKKQHHFAFRTELTDTQQAERDAVVRQVEIYDTNHRAFGKWGVKHRETP